MRTHLVRISAEYRESLWVKWPTTADWPAVMDLYEAAAYLRVSYSSIRSACHPARDRKAQLRHQRIGAAIRISKAALDRYGLVEERA